MAVKSIATIAIRTVVTTCPTAIAAHAEHGQRRDRLNHDDAVKDQVPKSESSPQACGSASRSGCHVRVLDYDVAKLSTIKTIKPAEADIILPADNRSDSLALHSPTGNACCIPKCSSSAGHRVEMICPRDTDIRA